MSYAFMRCAYASHVGRVSMAPSAAMMATPHGQGLCGRRGEVSDRPSGSRSGSAAELTPGLATFQGEAGFNTRILVLVKA